MHLQQECHAQQESGCDEQDGMFSSVYGLLWVGLNAAWPHLELAVKSPRLFGAGWAISL